MRRQNALILISEIVEQSDFSDTAYNSTYVGDVQSLIAKSTLQTIFSVLKICCFNVQLISYYSLNMTCEGTVMLT